jgi:hypothetical protein
METAAQTTKTPDYSQAADCLTSLYDATAKLTSTAARGKQYSKSDRMEVTGLVMLARMLAEAACVDLDGAYRSISGGEVGEFQPDARWANRALLALNERLVKSIKELMTSHVTKNAELRAMSLEDAFDGSTVRELYAIVREFASATGVQVESMSPALGEKPLR